MTQVKIGDDGSQNYLIFQPIYKTPITFASLPDTIAEWESKGLSNEKLSLLLNQILVILQNWYGWTNYRIRIDFKGSPVK